MRRVLVVVLLLASCPIDAYATDVEDRAQILHVELTRGPTAALGEFVRSHANAARWKQAVRAAGRIGDVSADLLPELLKAHAPDPEGVLVHGCPDPRLLVWSAGLPWVGNTTADDTTRTKWGDAVRPYLEAKDELLVAAAAHALGWIGARGVGDDLLPLLHHAHPLVRTEALNALGRAGREGHLERCASFLQDGHADISAAAQFACWRLAGRRRAAAQKDAPKGVAWKGDAAIARQALALLTSEDAETRMGALRIAGLVLDETVSFDGARASLEVCARDLDPRVAQDFVWRILQGRKGPWVELQLIKMALRADPKIRGLAYDALAKRESPETLEVLRARADAETDERLLDQLGVALMKRGDGRLVDRLLTETPSGDPVLRSIRRAEAFVAMKSKRSAAVVQEWLSLENALAGAEHTAVWMTALDGLQEREDGDVKAWIRALATSKDLRAKRPYLAAAALSAFGKAKPPGAWKDLCALATELVTEKPISDIDTSLMDALLATRPDGDEAREELVKLLILRVASAPSEFSRQAAAKHLKELVPELGAPDPSAANDWRGLPRPTKPLPGLALAGDSAFLDEAQILRIADWIQARRPTCVFETSAGTIRVTLHPETAPAHSVNLLLACHADLYEGSRFHRVVPNFVIQGGDPHGHGAGSGGWTVPDEITPWPYARGALGMPKSTKDDGGCQIFIMHAGYRPLDERYTNYATVSAGMSVVDRIRVGDQITTSRVELP